MELIQWAAQRCHGWLAVERGWAESRLGHGICRRVKRNAARTEQHQIANTIIDLLRSSSLLDSQVDTRTLCLDYIAALLRHSPEIHTSPQRNVQRTEPCARPILPIRHRRCRRRPLGLPNKESEQSQTKKHPPRHLTTKTRLRRRPSNRRNPSRRARQRPHRQRSNRRRDRVSQQGQSQHGHGQQNSLLGFPTTPNLDAHIISNRT